MPPKNSRAKRNTKAVKEPQTKQKETVVTTEIEEQSRNLAQAFHYQYHSTVRNEQKSQQEPQQQQNQQNHHHQQQGEQRLNPATDARKTDTPGDWLTPETRMKKLKESAALYSTSFSAAFTNSLNMQETLLRSRNRNKQTGKNNLTKRCRSLSWNSLMGLKGLSASETDAIIREQVYPPPIIHKKEIEIVPVVDVKDKRKGAKAKPNMKVAMITRKPKSPIRNKQKDIVFI